MPDEQYPPTDFDSLMRWALDRCPNAEVLDDGTGQLIVYTGMREYRAGEQTTPPPDNTTTPAAHTPGPWAAHGETVFSEYAALDRFLQTNVVCRVSNRLRMSDAQREANARLIAAAPEMLKALQSCVDAIGSERNPTPGEAQAREAALAALAAARGTPQ